MDFDELDPVVPEIEEESDELTTAGQVVKKLQEVWMNEMLSPELLRYEEEVVECLLDQVQHMEKSLEKITKGDFRLVCHKMELDRIKYVINSYLRTRLEKIEKFAAILLKEELEDPMLADRMSNEERRFALEHVQSTKSYLKEVALSKMPSNMQTLSLEESGEKPQLDRFVFIRAKKECKGVILDAASAEQGDDEITDFAKGSQHVLRYKPIAPLLKNGSIQLI